MLLRVHLGHGEGAVIVEVETPEDAVRLQQAYMRATNGPSSTSTSGRVRPPTNRTFSPPAAQLTRPPAHVIFKNGHYPALEGLYRSGDKGLSSDDLMTLLDLPSVKSLPPTIAAWNKRARSIELDLDDLLEVDRGYAHGKPQTTYRLTKKGREVLSLDAEEARTNEGSGPTDKRGLLPSDEVG